MHKSGAGKGVALCNSSPCEGTEEHSGLFTRNRTEKKGGKDRDSRTYWLRRSFSSGGGTTKTREQGAMDVIGMKKKRRMTSHKPTKGRDPKGQGRPPWGGTNQEERRVSLSTMKSRRGETDGTGTSTSFPEKSCASARRGQANLGGANARQKNVSSGMGWCQVLNSFQRKMA